MKTEQILKTILSNPTAPFREGWVVSAILKVLVEHKIPHCRDSYGNIIAGIQKLSDLRGTARLGFMAHMDHPGFHVIRRLSRSKWKARWLGGAPFAHMKNAAIRVYHPQHPDVSYSAQITKVDSPRRRSKTGLMFEWTLKEDSWSRYVKNLEWDLTGAFGAFDFEGYLKKGNRIHSRACDDLVGVSIALGALIDFKKKLKNNKNLIGPAAFFTRAEEVGFIGCLSLLRNKVIRKNLWIVSLEASKTLPGADIGQGPVLRLGDASSIFNPEFSMFLYQVAKQIKAKNPGFKFQRRLMDGGSCEATALSLYKIPTTGISIPLGHYHNQGHNQPAAENVSLNDVDHARQLCLELARQFYRRNHYSKRLFDKIEENFNHFKKQFTASMEYSDHEFS